MAAAVLDDSPLSATALPVFALGSHTPTCIPVPEKSNNPSSPPKSLFIVSPIEEGTYPVILFFPGTSITNNSYSQLFQHISSHGFIVVSPQLYKYLPPSGNTEVDSAALVTNWLPQGLKSCLPEKVQADLKKLVLSGHSRGGEIAFALSLGYATNPATLVDQFSAIVAIDPVGDICKCQLSPNILSHYNTFNLLFPITVIGTGLGGVTKCVLPCAPESVNHDKFYQRCNAPKAHFVTRDYGHMDVLDDNVSDFLPKLCKGFCTSGKGSKDAMRRCVGGIVVAFMNDFVSAFVKDGDFMTIVRQPDVAPAVLTCVEFVEE